MELEERLLAAQDAARQSGEMLIRRNAFHVEKKAAKDFVTDSDRASERLIVEALRSRFPGDGFWGEEGGVMEQKDGMWVIDPIDGTTNFIRANVIYTISIAYLYRGVPMVGVVYAPVLGEMYTAIRGKGAFLNGQPIHVSDISDPMQALVHISFVHRNPDISAHVMPQLMSLLPQVNDFRRMGSAAYDLCSVACGRAEAFLEPCLNLYDIAAGVLIVSEAGGKTTGWRGGEDCLISGHTLSSNGLIHEFLDERLSLPPAR